MREPIIEKLDRKSARRAFPAGGSMSVRFGPGRTGRFPGVLSSWSGHRCRITPGHCQAANLPRKGSPVEILASRLDGLHRVPGILEKVEVPPGAIPGQAEVILGIRVDFAQGKRVQQRAFYRLSGQWWATLYLDGTRSDLGRHAGYRCRVSNLSAGGMLVEDPGGLLAPGERFAAQLDLQDGHEPLRIRAKPVRRETGPTRDGVRWGCRFLRLGIQDETRIAYCLSEKIRARLAVRPGVRRRQARTSNRDRAELLPRR